MWDPPQQTSHPCGLLVTARADHPARRTLPPSFPKGPRWSPSHSRPGSRPVRRRRRLRAAPRRQDRGHAPPSASATPTTCPWPTRPASPGSAPPSPSDPTWSHDYTWKSNVVAVVTDGTAVLGLGDIGPAASLPVMEGKALLFKQFGGVDAVPIALDCTDVDEIVETVVRLAPTFGGINLEDISAPRCFEIERRLQERLDIPVFHDDQHGTAVVVLAALRNARRAHRAVARRPARGDLRRRRGRGRARQDPAARPGIGDLAVADRKGVLHADRADLTRSSAELAATPTQAGLYRPPGRRAGRRRRLHRRLRRHGARGGGRRDGRRARSSSRWPTRTPRSHPDVAHRHAAVVATGRSRLPEPDQQRARVPRHLPRAPSTSGPPGSPRA